MGLRETAERAATSGSDLERQHQGPALADRLTRLEEEFARAIPSGEARQLVQDALACVRTIKQLDKCEPVSVLGAIMTCAQLGLRPGILGHAWPLPFWDTKLKGYRAQLIIGYQGYIHLGYQSDRVADFSGRAVHEKDVYEVEYGLQPNLIHRPAKGDRGPIVAYYGTFRTTTGGAGFHDMTHAEVLDWRERYAPRGYPNKDTGVRPFVGPWQSPEGSADFVGMALKTQVRQLSKWMPKSAQLASAAQVDGTVRTNLDALADPGTASEPPTEVIPCDACMGTLDAHDDACPAQNGGAR